MTLRFMDSFDHYDSDDITRKWTSKSALGTTIQSVIVRNGVNAIEIDPGSTGRWVSKTFDDQVSWVVGFGFYAFDLTNNVGLLQFVDLATVQAQVILNANGTLEVRRGGTASDAGTAVTDGASILTISAATWYHVEMKVTIANSIGASTCVVRVNEVDWITVATGQDLQITGNATADIVRIGHFSTSTPGNGPYNFDDLYVLDGGAGLSDFLGDNRVEAKMPDGNGTTNQWTGSDADSTDNFEHVDEIPADDDATYVEDSTPGNQDLYAVDDLDVAPGTINGVQTNILATKTEAGSRSLMALIRSGVTTFDGDTHALSQGSYEYHHSIDENDPNTAAAWLEADFNAAEFGQETI